MRRPDEMPMDPDVLAELEVIDLTLAGEPVDPEYAELAELALMLQMERQPPREEYARRLDARASVRFKPRPITGPESAGTPPPTWTARLRQSLSGPGPRVGLVGLVAAGLAVVVLVNTHGSTINGPAVSGSSSAGPAVAASSTTSSAASASGGAGALHSKKAAGKLKNLSASQDSSASPSSGSATSRSAPTLTTPGATGSSYSAASQPAVNDAASATIPIPRTPGRKVVQSAQLTLSSANNRIDAVTQEVFNVVAQEHGIVKSSHVTSVSGKRGGNAFFSLSIPTGNLETTLQDLSTLKFAHVVSRTNSATDVTKTYKNENHQLQDAQALRTSLLKQLAAAVTQTQIDSLNQQIHDVEARITRLQNQLNALQHRVSFSSVSVQLYSGTPPPILHQKQSSGGFTISSALHDAVRVLVVAAGVILIAAAAMVPVALLALLVYWIVDRLRRHRREEALDQV